MSIATASDRLADMMQIPFHASLSEDPMAQMIIERASKNIAFLGEVPPHLRRHVEWFRQVVMEVLRRNPDAEGFFHFVPEFVGEVDMRRLVGNTAPLDQAQSSHLRTISLAHSAVIRAEALEPPVRGAPISEDHPATITPYPLWNGSRTLGKCDVCEQQNILDSHIELAVQNTRTMLTKVCESCADRIIVNGKEEDLFKAIYEHGKFVR